MSIAIPSLRGAIAVPGWAKNELWRRARAVPSLDLRFAENRSLVDATTGLNLITFSRTSDATFVGSNGLIQTASAGTPRFDHSPITGESLGLLIEEQRTNLLLRSEEFDNASWSKGGLLAFGSGSTANAITAPTGTITADLLTEDTSTGQHRTWQTASNTVNTNAHTVSFYAKAKERTRIYVGIAESPSFSRQGNATFNLANGTVVSFATGNNGATGGTASIVDAGNGWYRCSYSLVLGGTNTSVFTDINIVSTGSTISYTGDGASGIYVWGAQLEVGAFPTSYIPTTTSAVTRAADFCSISGSNLSSWYRQDQGTIFAEGAVAQPASGGNQFIFRTSDNGYNNSVALNIQSSGFASLATAAAGVFDGVASHSVALTPNTAAKFAGAYAVNNLGLSFNGATVVTDLSATMPTALNRLDIGSDHLGFNRVRAGHIRRLVYWRERLANNVLQSITQ